MAETTPPGGQQVREAAAATIAPDAVTAAILAKHSAGERLTPQESGKLGWWRSQLNKLKGQSGAAGAGAGQAQPGPGPGPAAGVGTLAPVQAPALGLEPVPIDTALIKRTTASVLKSADSIARRYVAREARKAGADDRAALRFDSAVALPAASQELMVDTSPEVLAALGMDPRHYPITVFCGALGLWATNIWLCVDELKALQKETETKSAAAAPAGSAPVSLPGPGAPLPAPAPPPAARPKSGSQKS